MKILRDRTVEEQERFAAVLSCASRSIGHAILDRARHIASLRARSHLRQLIVEILNRHCHLLAHSIDLGRGYMIDTSR